MELLNQIAIYISIAVIACGCGIFLLNNLNKKVNEKANQKRGTFHHLQLGKISISSEWIIFSVLLLIAIALRAWQFGSIPGGVNQDGAMAGVDAKALLDHGTDRYGMKFPVHFTAWGYGQMSVLLSYMMIPFIKIFGLTAIAIRLPMLIISIAGLIALYLLIKSVFGVTMAQIALIISIANPWHFMQSRWALDCNVFPHVFVLGLYFLHKGIVSKKRNLFISMFFFAMCMYSYGISFYTVPFFLFFFAGYLGIKKLLKWKEILLAACTYIFFSWPIYIVMIINMVGGKTISTPFFTMPYFPYSVRSQDILFFADHKVEQLVRNFKSLMNIILYQKQDVPWNSIKGFGTVYLFFVPFAIMGLVYLIVRIVKEKEALKKAGMISMLLFFFMGIWGGLITREVNVNRINIIFYAMIILIACGIYYVWEQRKILACILIPVYLFFAGAFVQNYFTEYPKTMSYLFFEGLVESLEDIENSDRDVYYITPKVENASYISEILTLFGHQIDAHYYQGKTNIVDGEETLPYAQKYQYREAASVNINPDENAAYVILSSEMYLFPQEKFDITVHHGYCSVIPKE